MPTNSEYQNALIDNLNNRKYPNGHSIWQFERERKTDKGTSNWGVNYYLLNRSQPDYRINPLAKSLGSSDSMSTVWRDTYRFWSKMNENGLGGHYNVNKSKYSYGFMDQVKYRNFSSRVFRYTDETL